MQTLVLDSTTDKIVAVLSGAITTTQPDFTAHFADNNGTTFSEGELDGTFNSTTQVDIVTAPAASTRRIIKNITVYNRDTASITFTLKFSANGTLRFITQITLAANASWDFSPVPVSGLADVTTTKADLLVRSSSAIARLAVGSDAQVLTADSAQTLGVKWATAAAAGLVKIAQVVTSGSVATITFSSIAGTYTDLKILLHGRDTAAGSNDLQVRIKINSDATSGNYLSSQYLYNNSTSTASATTLAASAAGAVIATIPGSSGLATAVGSSEITINGYAGTTFHKTIRALNSEYSGNAVPLFNFWIASVWKSTAAITDIVLTAGGTAFLDGTTATLYGMG
jgi:hypothetical protein